MSRWREPKESATNFESLSHRVRDLSLKKYIFPAQSRRILGSERGSESAAGRGNNADEVKLLKSLADLDWELYSPRGDMGEQLAEQKIYSRVGSGNDQFEG